jgi:hypothetical protein
MLEVERILMVHFTATQARAEGVALSTDLEGGQTKAATAKLLNAFPPPTIDGVDRFYCQLVEIHTIAAAQLAECDHWRQFDPSSLVWEGTGW